MGQYSLGSYFQNMKTIGAPIKKVDEANRDELLSVENEIREHIENSLKSGKPDERKRGNDSTSKNC